MLFAEQFATTTDRSMEHFQNLTLPSLIDKLAEYTAKYSQIRTKGGSKEDFNNCVLTLKYLTNEIELRKKTTQPENEIISKSQTIFFEE
jgi:hypothetical protein